MDDLANRVCVPCTKGTKPFSLVEIEKFLEKIDKQWTLVEIHHIKRTFLFKNFKEALDFVNKVGAIAESTQHHPDIFLSWGKVEISLWTHKIKGLSEADFIVARKIDQLV